MIDAALAIGFLVLMMVTVRQIRHERKVDFHQTEKERKRCPILETPFQKR
jgi:hypothetical protein